MINLGHICEYYIWWPDKDKDPNRQVCHNWAPSGRWMFGDDDHEDNEIFIRLCPEHLTEILQRSKQRPKPKPDKLKYYRVTKYTVDQDMDDSGEIVIEGYDYCGDEYVNEAMSIHSDEKEPHKYRYLIEEVQPSPEKEYHEPEHVCLCITTGCNNNPNGRETNGYYD
jgi:hypothetical protein